VNIHSSKMPSNLSAHVALIGANVIFGIGNVVSKLGLHRMNPFLFALIREVIAGPALLLISCMLERGRAQQRKAPTLVITETRGVLARRFLLSGVAMYGSNACYIVGVKLVGAACGAIWQSAQPLFIALMAAAVGFEPCTLRKASGILIACAGCAFVSLYDAWGHVSGAAADVSLLGNGLFLLQLLCVSTFWVSQKPLLSQFPPLATLAYGYAVATVLMSVTAVAFTSDRALLNLTCADCQGDGWSVPPDAWLAIMYWVFPCSVLAYFLNTWGNVRVHASVVGVYAVVQPLVTILASEVIILTSKPPHYHLAGVSVADSGAIAIFIGLLLVVTDAQRTQGREQGSRLERRLLNDDRNADDSSGSSHEPEADVQGTLSASSGHAA
jgi:drug/metabolite transporter (DMT)-like permease